MFNHIDDIIKRNEERERNQKTQTSSLANKPRVKIEREISRQRDKLISGNDTHSKNTELKNTELKNTELKNTELKNTELKNTELKNTELKNTELKNTELKNTELKNTELKNTELKNTELKNTELKNTELKNTELEDYQVFELEDTSLSQHADKAKDLWQLKNTLHYNLVSILTIIRECNVNKTDLNILELIALSCLMSKNGRVAIPATSIARSLKTDREVVRKSIKNLVTTGLIQYEPPKKTNGRVKKIFSIGEKLQQFKEKQTK